MGREIKFRAWDKVTEKLRYDIEIPKDYFERYGRCDLLNMFVNLSRRYDFMQFTGLKDKKGKDIYEGDFVLEDDGEESIWGFVEWNNEQSMYKIHDKSIKNIFHLVMILMGRNWRLKGTSIKIQS